MEPDNQRRRSSEEQKRLGEMTSPSRLKRKGFVMSKTRRKTSKVNPWKSYPDRPPIPRWPTRKYVSRQLQGRDLDTFDALATDLRTRVDEIVKSPGSFKYRVELIRSAVEDERGRFQGIPHVDWLFDQARHYCHFCLQIEMGLDSNVDWFLSQPNVDAESALERAHKQVANLRNEIIRPYRRCGRFHEQFWLVLAVAHIDETYGWLMQWGLDRPRDLG